MVGLQLFSKFTPLLCQPATAFHSSSCVCDECLCDEPNRGAAPDAIDGHSIARDSLTATAVQMDPFAPPSHDGLCAWAHATRGGRTRRRSHTNHQSPQSSRTEADTVAVAAAPLDPVDRTAALRDWLLAHHVCLDLCHHASGESGPASARRYTATVCPVYTLCGRNPRNGGT
jgi:hypothetical protein